jgi:hypothetical protein
MMVLVGDGQPSLQKKKRRGPPHHKGKRKKKGIIMSWLIMVLIGYPSIWWQKISNGCQI